MNKTSNQGQQKKKKTAIGTVTSVRMQKTALVEVMYMRKHPVYKKTLRRTRRFACHNELPDISVGDTVEIREVRPISKTKHFSIVRKIERKGSV